MHETTQRRLPLTARFIALFAGLAFFSTFSALSNAAPAAVAADPSPQVSMKTTMGDRRRTEPRQGAQVGRQLPAICEKRLLQEHIFHRVIDGFMIQGGGFD